MRRLVTCITAVVLLLIVIYTTPSITDINECAEDLDNCHQNAICANRAGRFTCTCRPGFTGDGVMCTAQLPQQVSPSPIQTSPCGKHHRKVMLFMAYDTLTSLTRSIR